LHASDAASACRLLLETEDWPEMINIGTGVDYTVREIAEKTTHVVGFKGEIVFTGSVSNGTSRKLLSSNKILALGWKPEVTLEEGLRRTYASYLKSMRGSASTYDESGFAGCSQKNGETL